MSSMSLGSMHAISPMNPLNFSLKASITSTPKAATISGKSCVGYLAIVWTVAGWIKGYATDSIIS